MAKPTQRERLAIAEAALGQLETELGAAFQSLRSASAIAAYFATRRGYDPEGTPGSTEKDLVQAARACCGVRDAVDEQTEMEREGLSPAQQLITAARDLADAYAGLTQEIESKGARLSVYGTWESAVRELMVHEDLLPLIERLRTRFPGPGDALTAQRVFHFERRGGEFVVELHNGFVDNQERL